MRGEDEDFLQRSRPVLAMLRKTPSGFAVMRDAQGKELLTHFADGKGKTTTTPEGLDTFLHPLTDSVAELATMDYASASRSGITFYGGTPLYLPIWPVQDADDNVLGTVTLGTVLSEAYFEQQTQFDGYMFTLSRGNETDNTGVQRVSSDDAEAVLLLTDIDGEPVRLTVHSNREVYQTGRRALVGTVWVLVLIAVVFIAVMYVVTTSGMIRPIERLTSDIASLPGTTEGLSDQSYMRAAEFQTLTEAINGLVRRLNETNMSLAVFDHILNGMNAYLYVSDPMTGEVIFINDRMREHFDIDESCIGKPCWQLLKNEWTDRCAYCPLPELAKDPSKIITWEEQNRRTGRYYRNSDSLIQWMDGSRVHLHHRVDITDLKEVEAALTRRLKQQALMSDISRGFIETRESDSFIQDTLRAAGEFIGAGRALVTHIDPNTLETTLTHEWANSADRLRPLGDKFKPFTPGHPVYDALVVRGEPYLAVSDIPSYQALAHFVRDGAKAFCRCRSMWTARCGAS